MTTDSDNKQSTLGRRSSTAPIEWPTVVLAGVIYGLFGVLTWFDHVLPWWLVMPLGAYLAAWHGSLQHEAIHEHPTASQGVNEALVLPSLWLWLPYRIYRDTHRLHHNDETLTDPLEDPESYYRTLGQWIGRGHALQALYWITNTVAGRLALGPLVAVCGLLSEQLPRLARGDAKAWRDWAMHAVGLLIVLTWAVGVCDIGLFHYFLLYAYPGTALSMLRSFCEHQAADTVHARTVIVEAEAPLALLFLNNNLHLVHHNEPNLAWYRLPERYRGRRAALLRDNENYRFAGYTEIVLRYLLWPKEPVVHPLTPWGRSHDEQRAGW